MSSIKSDGHNVPDLCGSKAIFHYRITHCNVKQQYNYFFLIGMYSVKYNSRLIGLNIM